MGNVNKIQKRGVSSTSHSCKFSQQMEERAKSIEEIRKTVFQFMDLANNYAKSDSLRERSLNVADINLGNYKEFVLSFLDAMLYRPLNVSHEFLFKAAEDFPFIEEHPKVRALFAHKGLEFKKGGFVFGPDDRVIYDEYLGALTRKFSRKN